MWCEKKERCCSFESSENKTIENLPMICSKVLEIKILIRRIEISGVYIPHIAMVVIGHDGSVYMREILDDPRSNDKMDNEMGSGVYHDWYEFKAMDTVNFHPATMIEEWATREHISLTWLGVN
jgi:hypothetical protein